MNKSITRNKEQQQKASYIASACAQSFKCLLYTYSFNPQTTTRFRQGAVQEWSQNLETRQYGSKTGVPSPSARLPLNKKVTFNSQDVLQKVPRSLVLWHPLQEVVNIQQLMNK